MGQADFELSVLLTDDEGIRSLNRKFRKIDSSTDVLSFPMHEEGILGDIAISIPTAIEQARAESLPLDEEITLLLIHGLLHLLGHDHEKSETDARRMHEEEKRLLRLVTN